MKTLTISQDDFKKGLVVLQDDSMAPFGSARKMSNVMISDRGGIQTRPGTLLLGDYNSSTSVLTGLYNFKKSGGDGERLIKGYGTELEFYFATAAAAWNRLKTGFTADQQFGFTTSLVNVDNDDFTYFCNRAEDYQRWRGPVTLLNGALAGAETAVTVDSTLKTPVYESKTATASAATTLDVAGTPWVSSQWVNFYVYITSGVHSGKIRLISANTSSQITFATLGSDPGLCTFQIRQIAFPATGTLIYGGTTIAYTAIPTATTFTVGSAHAAADNTAVTLVPETYPGAPKGNRIDTLLGRVFVGNVRSALSRDGSGNLQGSTQAGAVFVSKIINPTDFSFSGTRVAGEGDMIAMPYGGDQITDAKAQEDVMYVYKPTYIEAIKYSGDSDDIAIRQPQKTGVGSVGRVIKGKDDQYFITVDKQFTSIGRVRTKDLTPQTQNIGLPIKRLLDTYNFDDFNGIEFRNRILMAVRQSDDETYNNLVLLLNKETRSFEGTWTLPAGFFEVFEDELYYGESSGANVWKMFTGKGDIQGSTTLPITSEWQSNFFNVLPIKSNIQAICSVAVEGYIKANTSFTFNLFKDFATDAALSFTFAGTEDEFLTDSNFAAFLGGEPLGLSPIGTIDEVDTDGRRRFSFIVYFPYVYGQYFSTGLTSTGTEQDWEVIRVSLGLKESISTRMANTKTI